MEKSPEKTGDKGEKEKYSELLVCSMIQNEGNATEQEESIQEEYELESGHNDESQLQEIEEKMTYLPPQQSPENEKLREEKLSHIDSEYRERLFQILRNLGVIAWGLKELRPAIVPVKHSFELNDMKSIFQRARHLHPKYQKS